MAITTEPGVSSDEQRLVRLSRGGEHAAFAELVEAHQVTVFGTALRIVHDREVAAEVSNRVFYRAYEHLASFDESRPLRPWLVRIAANEALNELRTRRRDAAQTIGGGSVVAAGENVDSFGQVGRGMTIGGGTLQLAGPVGGPVMARVQTLTVAPTARIAGNLDYQAKQEASLPSGAVSGAVSFTSAPQQAPQPAPLLNGLFDLGGLIALVGTFLIGALAIILAPRAAARANELGRQQPWLSFGLGLVVLVCVPVAAALVAITLVGIPVAVCLIAVYVLGFLLAWPAVGLVVGTQLTRLVRADRPRPVLGALALGLIVLHLVSHVPFIGGLVALCAIVFGLGLEIQALRRWRRPTEQPRDTAPMAMAA